MLRGPYTTVRVRRESGRRLSDVSRLTGVPVCDTVAWLIRAMGGPSAAALAVLHARAAALGLHGDPDADGD